MLTKFLYKRTAELKSTNQELSETQQQLLTKERELTAMQFAGAAAHGMGQPLTSILLYCHLLEEALGSEDAVLKHVKGIKK